MSIRLERELCLRYPSFVDDNSLPTSRLHISDNLAFMQENSIYLPKGNVSIVFGEVTTLIGSKICTATTSYTAHPYNWQIITSPYYPDRYLDGLSCNWLITTDDALEVVKLKVLDSELENSTVCSKDVVHVYDGGTPRSPLLGSWCNGDTPEFISTGRKMYITFSTDEKAHFRGFKAKFISEQKEIAEFRAERILHWEYFASMRMEAWKQKECILFFFFLSLLHIHLSHIWKGKARAEFCLDKKKLTMSSMVASIQ
ncbi:unnamed protein product [Acanthosepion pharaonis]|uniref:CUB domain-containing protein n=1 Tax=Acanthosepion pharaonis TaxID=158019 RepID=A0A812CJL6_ACAPH|nr:unnamed protein product [Sepia pharaonis]